MSETLTAEQLAQYADAIVDKMIGEGGAAPGALSSRIEASIREQLDAQVGPKVTAMEENISELREALATAPPERIRPDSLNPNMDIWELLDAGKHNPAASGASLDGQFDNMRDFLTATSSMLSKRADRIDQRLRMVPDGAQVKAALTGEEIELGGALVPEEFRAQLLMRPVRAKPLRDLCMTLPMMSHTVSVPYVRDESHADGSIYGGFHMQWIEDGSEIPQVEPEFAQVRLTAKIISLLTAINNTLIADSAIDVVSSLMMMLPDALNFATNRAILRGSGAGQPLGIMNAPALVDLGTSSAEFTYAQATQMMSRLLPECYGRAYWVTHSSMIPDIAAMSNDSVSAVIFNLADDGVPMSLMGRPIIYSEHMPARNTNGGDVLLADFSMYLLGDRQALSMAMSEHAFFTRNRMGFRGIARMDGQPWMDTPLTQEEGGSGQTLSAFVTR